MFSFHIWWSVYMYTILVSVEIQERDEVCVSLAPKVYFARVVLGRLGVRLRLGPRSGTCLTYRHSHYTFHTRMIMIMIMRYWQAKVIQGYDRARLWYDMICCLSAGQRAFKDRAVPRLRSIRDRAKKPMRALAHLWTSLNPKFLCLLCFLLTQVSCM